MKEGSVHNEPPFKFDDGWHHINVFKHYIDATCWLDNVDMFIISIFRLLNQCPKLNST